MMKAIELYPRSRFASSLSVLCVITAILYFGPSAKAQSSVQLTAAISSEGAGIGETSLGDIAADAIRSSSGADIAVIDSESLRPLRFEKGQAKVSQLLTVFSSPTDTVVVMKLKGAVIAAALEHSVSNLPQSSPGFLQVSGLAFSLNASSRPGTRAAMIAVNGNTLDKNAFYAVAMPASLAEGAAGYFLVWPSTVAPSQTGLKLADSLSSYLAAHPTITPGAPRIIL